MKRRAGARDLQRAAWQDLLGRMRMWVSVKEERDSEQTSEIRKEDEGQEECHAAEGFCAEKFWAAEPDGFEPAALGGSCGRL